MCETPLSRRRVLRRAAAVGAGMAGALALPAARAGAQPAPRTATPPECVLDVIGTVD